MRYLLAALIVLVSCGNPANSEPDATPTHAAVEVIQLTEPIDTIESGVAPGNIENPVPVLAGAVEFRWTPIAGATSYQVIATDITTLSAENLDATLHQYAELHSSRPQTEILFEETGSNGEPLVLAIQVTAWDGQGDLVGESEPWVFRVDRRDS